MNIYVTSEQIGLHGYWITDILAGISKEAMKKNISVCDYDGHIPKINEENTRPIVLVVGYTAHWMENTCTALKREGIEPLLVNAVTNNYNMLGAVGSVSFDHQNSMYRVLQYLLDNKRHKIALFGALDETVSGDELTEEFLKATGYLELETTSQDIYRKETLQASMAALQYQIGLYNAVICTSDTAAVFLSQYLKSKGINIPRDIFVIGFGNLTISADLNPSVTTVECNYFQLGKHAVKLHQFLQRNTDISGASVTVDGQIIPRQSTAAKKVGTYQQKSDRKSVEPLYDLDPDSMMILQAEELLRMWDDIDRSILQGLLADKTIAAIADGLFISVSTVKYRLRKMLTAASLKNKEELIAIIRKYNVFGGK